MLDMKILRSSSLASNITIVVLLASSVSLAVFTIVSVWLIGKSAITQLEARLSNLANVVGQNSSAALDFNDRDAAVGVLQALQNEPRVISGCLYNLSGSLFAEYHRDRGEIPCPDSQPL